MFSVRFAAAVCAATMVGACGGGGGSDAPAPPVQVPAPPSVVSLPVTLSAATADVNVAEGQTADFGFTATYSGSSSQPVVADVVTGDNRYQLSGTPTASGTSFAVALRTVPLAPGGRTTSTVTFRLCTSSDCRTVYPGSTQSFTVNLDVQLRPWSTLQRDAAHTGYVAANYSTARFAEAWSVATPNPPKGVAARRGSVFVNLALPTGRVVTRSINGTTGQQQWETDIGPGNYFSAPSYANGRVVSMAMDISSGNVPMPVLNADDGGVLRNLSYASQFSNGGTPTPLGDDLFFQAGYYGNVVYGANAASGVRRWGTDTSDGLKGFVHEGQSVAADESNVYSFRGGALTILHRVSGLVTREIVNPHFTQFGLSYWGFYEGAPILDGAGRIVTFTGNRGRTSALPLVAFDANRTEPLWRSSASYVGHPALKDGRIYAIRAGSAIVDMIDVATGSVVGSINLGSDKGELRSNVILTGSHLFVASDTATYAVDLKAATPGVVWTAPRGGSLAITPDNMLVVTATEGLFAYRLH